MKTLTKTFNWYCEVETRKWKRILECLEMSLISVIAIVISAIMYIYGDGTRLQPILIFFALTLSVLSALLVVPLYQSITFNRWHVQVIKLSFLCGLGASTLAGFIILELQLSST
jgi:hypothetical protein